MRNFFCQGVVVLAIASACLAPQVAHATAERQFAGNCETADVSYRMKAAKGGVVNGDFKIGVFKGHNVMGVVRNGRLKDVYLVDSKGKKVYGTTLHSQQRGISLGCLKKSFRLPLVGTVTLKICFEISL